MRTDNNGCRSWDNKNQVNKYSCDIWVEKQFPQWSLFIRVNTAVFPYYSEFLIAWWLAINSGLPFTAIFRATVTAVPIYRLSSPKAVSERAKTSAFGRRKYGRIHYNYGDLLPEPSVAGNPGTGLIDLNSSQITSSSVLLSNFTDLNC